MNLNLGPYRSWIQMCHLNREYFEDENGNEITSYEVVQHVSGQSDQSSLAMRGWGSDELYRCSAGAGGPPYRVLTESDRLAGKQLLARWHVAIRRDSGRLRGVERIALA